MRRSKIIEMSVLRTENRRLSAMDAEREKELYEATREAERLRKDNELMEEYIENQDAFHSGNVERLDAARKQLHRERQETAKWRRTAIAGAVLMAVAVAIMAVATFTAPVSAEENMDTYAPETEENALIENALLEKAHVIENCRITHYDICEKCCGKTDGITASGLQATPYTTVAVDPSVIPLGSDVLVDYGDGDIQYYRADDTGVKGNAIDLCVSSHEEAIQLGVKTATVYWIPAEVE